MLNYDGLIDRLQLLIRENELTASSFADKIGVQRSSISHILSGRNKPSLDFLAKIEHNFHHVSFHWLLKGEDLPSPTTPISKEKNVKENIPLLNDNSPNLQSTSQQQESKRVVDLVYIYSDGSFERFQAKT